MSDEQSNASNEPNESNDLEQSNTPTPAEPRRAMVRQSHGGALKPGGNGRIVNPTPADVSELARKRVYSIIPQLVRIAKNKPTRKRPGKRPYSVTNQLRAAAELRLLAEDRSLAESQIMANLVATSAEIYEFLPRDQAHALMQKIAPHWLRS